MNVDNAGNVRNRRTVIYRSPRPNSTEKEFRDSLKLLDNLLSSYEEAVVGLTRVLLSPDGGEEEEVTDCTPP